jgi:hypothetical protein
VSCARRRSPDLADDPDADAKQRQVDAACKVVSLSDLDRELIVRWLLNDHSLILGGNAIIEAGRK